MEATHRLDLNIFLVKTGSNPIDTEKVNIIQMLLHKHRIAHLIPHLDVHVYCYTDDSTGIETDFGIKILPLTLRDNITNPDFYLLDLLDDDRFDNAQNCYMDLNLMPLELCQTDIISACPQRGEAHELPPYITLDAETKLKIVSENLPILYMTNDWWLDEPKNTTHMIKWYGNEVRALKSKFNESPELAQLTSLAEFIDTQFKGFIYNPKLGFFAPFAINNQQVNEDFTEKYWDTKVRVFFPTLFDGIGGDADDRFVYYDHEWKTINRHVKFLVAQGEESPNRDLFLRSWVI
jgi:hypothetical protein